MNSIDIIDAVIECQTSANLSRKPYSICNCHGELIIMLKTKAVSLGYEICETCNPIKDYGIAWGLA